MEYIGGQILLAGPLAGFILLPAAFFYKTRNLVERGLKFTLAGIYIFFLLSSFRGKVEANWTSAAIVPLVILGHNFLLENTSAAARGRKWLFRLLPATLVLVLFARIIMIVDLLPVKAIRERYHAWKEWPKQMREITGGLPVVFENSYQRASKYWFYSGQMTYSLNWYRERRNNYNFWPIEDSLLGKPVFILDIHNQDSFQTKLKTPIGNVGYLYDSAFASFAKVKFIPDRKQIHVDGDVMLASFTVRAELPEQYRDYISSHRDLQTSIRIGVFGKNGWIEDIPVDYSLYEMIRQPQTINFPVRLKDGVYYLIFSIFNSGTLTGTHNSEKIKMEVL